MYRELQRKWSFSKDDGNREPTYNLTTTHVNNFISSVLHSLIDVNLVHKSFIGIVDTAYNICLQPALLYIIVVTLLNNSIDGHFHTYPRREYSAKTFVLKNAPSSSLARGQVGRIHFHCRST